MTLALNAFAGGQKEDKLSRAKELYTLKYYDKALLLLAEVVREDPDRRDQAIALSNKIINIRDEYNELYEVLIDTLYNKLDVDAALAIIEEMKEKDPYPNEKTKSTVQIAEDAASVVANKNYFENIMEEALTYIRENDFFMAVEVYLNGYNAMPPVDLHRSEFDAETLDAITESDVTASLSRIRETSEVVIEAGKKVKETVEGYIDGIDTLLVNGDIPSFDGLIDNFITIGGRAEAIKEAAETLKFQADRLRERVTTAKSVLYLKYLYQIATGREESKGYEGIIYAVEAMVKYNASRLSGTYNMKSESFLTEGKASFDRGAFEEARTNYRNAVIMSRPVLPVAYFSDTGQKLPEGFSLTTFSTWIIDEALISFMDAEEDAKKTLAYLYILDYQEQLNTFFAEGGTPDEEALRRFAADIEKNLSGIERLSRHWEGYMRERREKTPLTFNMTSSNVVISLCAKTISAFIGKQVQQLASYLSSQKRYFPGEKELLKTGEPHDEYGRVYYPDRRLIAFNRILESLSFLDESIETLTARWSQEDVLADQADLQKALSDAVLLKNEAALFREEVEGEAKTAEANILEAKKFRDIGNRRYDETQRAYRRDEFGIVEEKIREATDAYDNSLQYQEDATVRSRRLELVRLQQDIIKDLDRIVRREVERLIEKGIDLYAKALYEDSLSTFLTAEDRWNDTHTEENPEIKVWLGYVREALTIESERSISVKHPLYKEMMQLYNLAKQDYNDGVKLKREGNIEEGIASIRRAEEKLLKIKQQFPYNNDANILKLMCTKERDNSEYQETVRQIQTDAQAKLNEIKREKATTPGKVEITKDQRDAYNNLKDLIAVETKNTALKRLITDFENELFPGKAPVSEERKRLSQEKTEQAKPYVERKEKDYYPLAKELLAEAIELDPTNNRAKQLYNQVTIEEGPDKVWVLPPADKRRYEEALQLVIDGDYLRASTIVDQLLQKYSGYEDLVKLKNRIAVNL